tara:strand:+ start:477 stop:857 length:381 start_codon:yes stop_codon:yes gene_type:complete
MNGAGTTLDGAASSGVLCDEPLQAAPAPYRARANGGLSALGSGPINHAIEAFKWRTDRATLPAGKAGGLSKGDLVRDGSHLNVPQGFDQNGPSLLQKVWKYRHIPAPFFLAPSHFASNLDGVIDGS